MKQKTLFVCQNCQAQFSKWVGKCLECGQWNTLSEEEKKIPKKASSSSHETLQSVSLTDLEVCNVTRYPTSLKEVDQVLGGGLVPGSLVLIGGDPGIGKSTLLLQVASGLSQKNLKVLYVSGEENLSQVKLRAERINALTPQLFVSHGTSLLSILEHVEHNKPHVLVIDSIQTLFHADVSGTPGSVSQIRECTNLLMEFSKKNNVSTLIIGHVTKEGHIAGPKILEHLVDTVVYLEGERSSGYRILRSIKNRFGSTGEVGIFEMQGYGLKEVQNPSAIFLDMSSQSADGNAITVSLEGTRPLLAQIQSLVSHTTFPVPRRVVTGFDINRFHILLAVLEKKAGLFLGQNDIYANVSGGLRIAEPAIDLAIVASTASSFLNKSISSQIVFFGEVSLGGDILPTTHAYLRTQEALKMGFRAVFLPKRNYDQERHSLEKDILETFPNFKIIPVDHVSSFISLFHEGFMGEI
jgi:DNA repair protein RadA/Sms